MQMSTMPPGPQSSLNLGNIIFHCYRQQFLPSRDMFFIYCPSHLCLQESTEGSLLFNVLPAHRYCYAQHHDHHHEEAANHPCCDQRGSVDKKVEGQKKEENKQVIKTEEIAGNEEA